MKNHIAHMLLVLTVFGSVFAAPAATVEEVYAQAQSDRNFKRADSELSQLYKTIMAALPDNDKKALKEAQRKWIAGQQTAVDANPGREVEALYQCTLKRIEELRQLTKSDQPATAKESSSAAPAPAPSQPTPQSQDQPPKDFPSLKEAAERGDPKSQYYLGVRYYNGDGVEQNKSEAVKWFIKSSNMADVPLVESTGSTDTHKRANGWDDGPALSALGQCYAKGEGVKKDDMFAEKYFDLAAGLHNSAGMFNLGLFRENGTGGRKDVEEAARLYRQAAEQGYADAQTKLGVCYYLGQGVEKNKEEAVKWFRKAAEQGSAAGANNLATCYNGGDGVSQDKAEAWKWYKKAAEGGDAVAQHRIGIFYSEGDNVEKNEEEAARWFKKAADQGHAKSQVALGTCYLHGTGVNKDPVEAAKCYEKAANQGLADAQYKFGVLLAYGGGVQKDVAKAKEWITQAAANAEYYKANKEELDTCLDKLSAMQAPATPDNPKLGAFKVKGFFMGMDMNSAWANVVDKLGHSTAEFMECRDENDNPMIVVADKLNLMQLFTLMAALNPSAELSAAKNRAAGSEVPEDERYKIVCKTLKLTKTVLATFEEKKNTVVSVIYSDPGHRVCYVKFNGGLSNYFFNAKDLEAPAFADQFLEGYKLPAWQTVPDRRQSNSWTYTSAEGVKISIFPNKELIMQKVPSKEEQRSSFD